MRRGEISAVSARLIALRKFLPNFMVWKLCVKAQTNCAFPQNFHTIKLGEVRVFYAVWLSVCEADGTGREELQLTTPFPAVL